MKRALMLALVVLPLLAQAPQPRSAQELIGSPAGAPLSGAALEKRTKEVSSVLRCPVCQGLSVNDSPAEMAVNMKKEVRSLLAQGYTQEQVLSYFERSYGEFVRLQPPVRGINLLVWLGPIIALIAGAFIVAAVIRRSRAGAPAPAVENPPAEKELDPYLARARELAYGSKDKDAS